MKRSLLLALALAAGAPCPPASAAIPASLYDDAHCAAWGSAPLAYVFCDDGIPTEGGTTPNASGLAVTVPAKYGSAADSYRGLPAKAADAASVPGSDANGDVALDVDITLPLAPPPPGGYPLLVFMHGCCGGNKTGWESGSLSAAGTFDAGGEKWHYNNAWFASRGYVVVTYTARGFVNGSNGTPPNGGSTGQTEIDSRSFEINDFQHLACQVLASAASWTGKQGAGGGAPVAIDRNKVIATGGSYGGGFAWMALTDPIWTCTADTGTTQAMRLAAVAPRYGWTDLVHSLVPTGRHMDGVLPASDGCDSGPRRTDGSACPEPRSPVGIPKKTIDAALYASGATGVPPGATHTTFPPKIQDAIACLQSGYPVENSAVCDTGANGTHPLADTLPEFARERSAYYQNDWFERIALDAAYRVPVFDAATLTDPLFPPIENRRMVDRMRQAAPGYPIQMHFADHEHFVQNKARDWGDVCGTDRHVCANGDYQLAGGGYDFNAPPVGLRRVGISSRLSRFLDYYARPAGNPAQAAPAFDVTVTLQVCPGFAAEAGLPANESGDIFTAPTFAELTHGQVFVFGSSAAQTTTPTVSDPFNTQAEPVANQQANAGGACAVRSASNPAPAGEVATYDSAVLSDDVVMIGGTIVTATFAATDQTNPVTGVNNLQLNARLFDVFPSGDAALIDRGPRRVSPTEMAAGTVTFQLHGNAYRFLKGHRIRLELTQDDDPYLKRSDAGGNAVIQSVEVGVPRRVPSNRDGTVVVRPVASQAAGGAAGVAAADFSLYDDGDEGHAVGGFKVTVEHPELLTALTVSVEGQTVTLSPPQASNDVVLDTPVMLRPGGYLNFAASADVAMPMAGGLLANPAYAAGGPAGAPGASPAAALTLAALLLWLARRRRAGLVLAFAGLALLSCSGGDSGPPPLPANQARVSLVSVAATADDGQPASYRGLPVALGTITAGP